MAPRLSISSTATRCVICLKIASSEYKRNWSNKSLSTRHGLRAYDRPHVFWFSLILLVCAFAIYGILPHFMDDLSIAPLAMILEPRLYEFTAKT